MKVLFKSDMSCIGCDDFNITIERGKHTSPLFGKKVRGYYVTINGQRYLFFPESMKVPYHEVSNIVYDAIIKSICNYAKDKVCIITSEEVLAEIGNIKKQSCKNS